MSVALRRLLSAGAALLPLLATSAPPLLLPPVATVASAAASAPAVPSTPLRALPALSTLKPNIEVAPVARAPLLTPVTTSGTGGVTPQSAGNPANPGQVYVLIQAARQGWLKGEVTTRGLENASEVWQLNHVFGPTPDATNTLRLGTGTGQPLLFRHVLGAMAVQLQQAQVSNEKLNEVLIRSFAPDGAGRTLPVLNIRLLNATVTDVRDVSGDTPGAPLLQEVTLAYQRLELADVGSGLVAVDDRAKPQR